MPEPVQGPRGNPGSSPGRVTRYRVELPRAGIVPTERNRFEATEYAEARTGVRGSALDFKDRIIGRSMSSRRLAGERLSKKVALAIFSSDALSSTAYATQEIMLILVLAGTGALRLSLPIAMAIAALLAIVVMSYRQTIRAYPGGGGAYIVAHENLGVWPGLVAASSLLIDYVLTVAVSIAAGVEAIYSAIPAAHSYAVPIALALVLLVTVGNLRGIRESGTMFSIPTYGFVIVLSATLTIGIIKVLLGDHPNLFASLEHTRDVEAERALTLFLVLRAFSAGCTALTGIEAISNGVSAFKPPEARNAASTMLSMALILGALFLGTTLLARHYGIVYAEGDRETVMSQIGALVFGHNAVYYALQTFTALILILAANTSFNGFPLLGAILARDGYLPRIFHQRGNRLVFTYGIFALAGSAILLLVAFNASTTRLIPLYALGVFLSFTLAQTGMVRRWLGRREAGWQRSALINAVGAVATGLVFLIILLTKFAEGGWMVVVALPTLAGIAWLIGRFYQGLARSLRVPPEAQLDMKPRGPSLVPIIVPVDEINLATVMTIGSACEKSRSVTAVHVLIDPDQPSTVEARWRSQFPSVPLVVIDSPFRAAAEPIAIYVNDRLREAPHEITVMLPRIEVDHWYQRPLVNQSLGRLAKMLAHRRHVNVIEAPFSPGSRGRRKVRAAGE